MAGTKIGEPPTQTISAPTIVKKRLTYMWALPLTIALNVSAQAAVESTIKASISGGKWEYVCPYLIAT